MLLVEEADTMKETVTKLSHVLPFQLAYNVSS